MAAVKFFNNSGEDVPEFGCVLLSNTQQMVSSLYMLGAKPSAYGAQYSHGFNIGGIVPQDSGGLCSLGEMSLAAYDPNDGAPNIGEIWGPRSGTWLLKKDTGGFLVIGAPDATNNTVLVLPVPMLQVYGKADADISKGSAGSFTIWAGTPGSETTTGITMAGIYNRWGDISSGSWVRADFDGKQFQYAMAEC